MKHFTLLVFLTFAIQTGHAGYSDTLPKGVRNLTYRLIKTNKIRGSYNADGRPEGYNINTQINADVLRGLNASVDTYLDSLTPAEYAEFNFGTFEGNADSEVFVQALGGGYGITDTITIYGFIPFYKATVDLNLRRTEKGRKNVGSSVVLDGLPEIDVRIIQNLFVNYYEYKPLGKWDATGFGDLELGTMWRFYRDDDFGFLVNSGLVVPTGKEDNPDILQDISFGDGQWDAFVEIGGDYNPFVEVVYDAFLRLTYQHWDTRTVRQPNSYTFPMTNQKGEAQVKLGNKLLLATQASYLIDDEWTPSLQYSFEYKEKDNYESNSELSDRINENNTELYAHSLRANISYSTLNLFKKKKFILPAVINFAIQSVFGGKNTPKYERADLEFRLFF